MAFILLLLPRGDFQVWHQSLISMLRDDKHDIAVSWREGRSKSLGLSLVEELEQLFSRRHPRAGMSHKANPAGVAEHASHDKPDMVFDLSGSDHPEPGSIVPLYDAKAGDNARDDALLEERAPHLQLARVIEGRLQIITAAFPALERPWSLVAGRDVLAHRLIHLVRRVSRNGSTKSGVDAVASAHARGSPASFIARSLAARIARRLKKLTAHEGHWRIGWRRSGDGEGLYDTLKMPAATAWTWLGDDRQRYFTDPFIFDCEATTYVFCEEFPYATRSGIISVFTLDEQGRPSKPRPVLDIGTHLSYPYVFRHDGHIWMMPENSAKGTLDLYRAERFPDHWVFDRTLIAGRQLSDATPFHMNGHWWMTAADHRFNDSAWDTLALFESSSILGPWQSCDEASFTIDASCARPGGAVIRHNGALWRPAQDCRSGYGSGLTLCRIDDVSPAQMQQTIMAHLAPPSGAAFTAVHTLNLGAMFEIIDVAGWQPRAARPSVSRQGSGQAL